VPPSRERAALASRTLGGLLTGGIGFLALVAMASPARFGVQGGRAFGSGWPVLVLAAVALGCAAWVFARGRRLAWLVAAAREPFRRPLEEDPAYAGLSGALAACRGPLKTRFALGWIWGPAVAGLVAAAACLSAAYFLVDAVLARFEVGWQQPVLAAADLTVAWVLLRIVAGRLAVWPLAVAGHRAATVGYP
jgi:hypothetical protein